MLTITNTFRADAEPFCPAGFQPTELLYFDIETTGFSAEISNLYLIGCFYFDKEQWQTIQWFADDYHSEEVLLCTFFEFMKDFRLLIHYNGSTFDIPYLQKKCRQYKLPYDFSQIESLDIYKELLPYKKILPVDNLKQKTVEQLLGINRKDTYDGGQLIKVYGEYLHHKLMKQADTQELLSLLLLHNKEDLEGLSLCSRLLSPPVLTWAEGCLTQPDSSQRSGQEAVQEPQKASDTASYMISLPYRLTAPLQLETAFFTLDIDGGQGCLSLYPQQKELKYFYPDYKNYYYLPLEDNAIHKSVAAYVDKAYREKAHANNCYTRHSGSFLPLPDTDAAAWLLPPNAPLFYEEYRSPVPWFEPDNTFFENTDNILRYIKAALLAAK